MVKSGSSINKRRREFVKDIEDGDTVTPRGRESLRRIKGKGIVENSRRDVWKHGDHSRLLIDD